eukprot:10393104-Heterocapsa_arctica.AAC.1
MLILSRQRRALGLWDWLAGFPDPSWRMLTDGSPTEAGFRCLHVLKQPADRARRKKQHQIY